MTGKQIVLSIIFSFLLSAFFVNYASAFSPDTLTGFSIENNIISGFPNAGNGYTRLTLQEQIPPDDPLSPVADCGSPQNTLINNGSTAIDSGDFPVTITFSPPPVPLVRYYTLCAYSVSPSFIVRGVASLVWNGTNWIALNQSGGETGVGFNANFFTRFTDADLTGTSGTSTLSVDYFLQVSEFSANNRPDLINVNFVRNSILGDTQVHNQQKLILPLSDGFKTATTAIDYFFTDGSYTAFINFWNFNNNFITFSATGITIEFDVVGGTISVTDVDVTDGTDLEDQLAYEECSFSNISGCFVNLYRGFIDAITPDPDSFSQFANLWELIQNKPPFGYVTSMVALFTDFDADATPVFDFDGLPFVTSIFDPLLLLMASLLWFFYAVWLYKRLMKFEI